MIFRWIRNRRWNKRRLLFRFYDGSKIRSIDPVVAGIALHAHDTFVYRHLHEAANGDAESQLIVAQTASDVFGVAAVDNDGSHGLTISERVELMMAFDLWLMALKKNIARSPTSATYTVLTSHGSSETTTNDSLDSGSTDTDPIFDQLQSSDLESSQSPTN